MKCKNAKILISAAADGELSQRESLALDEHLASCAECRREQKAVRGVRRALTTWEPSEPAESLTDAFMLRLSREREAEAHSWRTLFFSRLPATGLASAATFVILVAVYVATIKPGSQAPSIQPPSVAIKESAPEKPKIATLPDVRPTPTVAVAPTAPARIQRSRWMAYVPHRVRRHRIERDYAKPEQPVVVACSPAVARAASAVAESFKRDKEREVAEQMAKIGTMMARDSAKIEEGITRPGVRSNRPSGNYDSGAIESPG
jgi:hypothetical protein